MRSMNMRTISLEVMAGFYSKRSRDQKDRESFLPAAVTGDSEFPECNQHLIFYRIADRAKFVQGHFSGIGNLPIFSLARADSWALAAAAHRGDEIKFDIRQF